MLVFYRCKKAAKDLFSTNHVHACSTKRYKIRKGYKIDQKLNTKQSYCMYCKMHARLERRKKDKNSSKEFLSGNDCKKNRRKKLS